VPSRRWVVVQAGEVAVMVGAAIILNVIGGAAVVVAEF
jgi:hypothetical protein